MSKKELPYKHFDVIQKPLVTEKSTNASQFGQVFFIVRKDATKPEIKAAVEHVFNVKVASVNTANLKGKTKRFRGRLGQQSDVKKAMVTLVDGQQIDMGTGA